MQEIFIEITALCKCGDDCDDVVYSVILLI